LAESTAKLYESVWRKQKNDTDSNKRTLISVAKHWKKYCRKGYDLDSRSGVQITSEQVAGITKESIQENPITIDGIPLVFSDVFPSLAKEGEAAKALQNIIEILKVSNFDDEIKLLFIATIVNNHNNKEK
jgi:hypothetical protein